MGDPGQNGFDRGTPDEDARVVIIAIDVIAVAWISSSTLWHEQIARTAAFVVRGFSPGVATIQPAIFIAL
ncbi:MAG TPA: hypothetical protein VGX94_04905 [Terriglobia bacterium]|nr:hypothetical protein [Terriglobia bacterium]